MITNRLKLPDYKPNHPYMLCILDKVEHLGIRKGFCMPFTINSDAIKIDGDFNNQNITLYHDISDIEVIFQSYEFLVNKNKPLITQEFINIINVSKLKPYSFTQLIHFP